MQRGDERLVQVHGIEQTSGVGIRIVDEAITTTSSKRLRRVIFWQDLFQEGVATGDGSLDTGMIPRGTLYGFGPVTDVSVAEMVQGDVAQAFTDSIGNICQTIRVVAKKRIVVQRDIFGAMFDAIALHDVVMVPIDGAFGRISVVNAPTEAILNGVVDADFFESIYVACCCFNLYVCVSVCAWWGMNGEDNLQLYMKIDR